MEQATFVHLYLHLVRPVEDLLLLLLLCNRPPGTRAARPGCEDERTRAPARVLEELRQRLLLLIASVHSRTNLTRIRAISYK